MTSQSLPKTTQKLQKQPKHLNTWLFYFMIKTFLDQLHFLDFLANVTSFLKLLSLFPKAQYSLLYIWFYKCT